MVSRVIDADGHICEPPAVWNDYIEKRYRQKAIRVEREIPDADCVVAVLHRFNLPWLRRSLPPWPTWQFHSGYSAQTHRV